MIPHERGIKRGPRGYPFLIIHPFHYNVYSLRNIKELLK
jgi:hypothetical protein